MSTRWLKKIIPGDLAVKVSMDVNETWRDDQTCCVNHLGCLGHNPGRNFGNTSVLKCNIGNK